MLAFANTRPFGLYMSTQHGGFPEKLSTAVDLRGKGQVQFLLSTLRAVPAHWTCALFRTGKG
jgi:hypothetical protein